MKKKQLFAVLLAGSMTMGMAPAAAFAAEDTSAAAEVPAADENTEVSDESETQQEGDTQADADAAAQETEGDTQADAGAGEQTDAQADADAAAQEAAEQQQLEEQQAAAAAAAETETQEDSTADATVNSAAELQDAINNAPAMEGTVDTASYDSAYKILVKTAFSLTDTITIPAGKNIAIFGVTDSSTSVETTIGRGSVTGDMFKVSAGSILSLTQNEADGSTTPGKLALDGAKDDGTAADGSIIAVEAGARFVMTTGVTLANNTSNNTENKVGAAITNSGEVVLTGGEIKDNVSADGAIYSTGSVSLQKTEEEPKIIENYAASDKSTPSNIVLGKDEQGKSGMIVVAAAFENPNIGYSVENPAEGDVIFAKTEEVDETAFAAAVNAMSYEGDANFKADTGSGTLVSNRPTVKITATEWKSNATTATATVTSTKDGTVCYAYVNKGGAAPSIENSKDAGSIEANGTAKIEVKNLSGSAIDLYVWVKAADGSVNAEPAKVSIKKQSPQIVAAVVKAVGSKWTDRSKVKVTLNTTKAGTCYYKAVKRGTKATNDKKTKVTVSKAGNFNISLTKLDTKNPVDLYVWFVDKDGKTTNKVIKLNESKRPAQKATIAWKALDWRDHYSATVTLIIGEDGVCEWTCVEKDTDKVIKKGTTNIKADKKFDIELNNLPNKDVALYVTAKDSKGNEIVLQSVKNGKVEKETKRFKLSLTSNRPATPTPVQPTPTDTPDAHIPPVTESVVQGLDEPLQFYPNTFYDFTVIGAGTDNQNPNEGDVKWVPLYWSMKANPSTDPNDKEIHTSWKIGSTKGINNAKTYPMYVFFQKYVYSGGQWVALDTVESAVYKFTSAVLTTQGADGANGQTGTDPNDPDATVTGEASATSSNGGNGTTSRNAVSTADNSPIGTMSALAVASLLAGGYVIVRRRKKEN